MYILFILFLSFICTGCSFFGFGHKTVSGLVCKSNFELGQQCTIFDPILKTQVEIDPNNGVLITCNLSVNKKYYNCYYTYSDAMGNSWSGKVFKESK